ncbi:MAG: hypothetical protein RBU37_17105, partial [Myxococcota bacterium]|nr:hypothetical protein [Myxococcota bacterium]
MGLLGEGMPLMHGRRRRVHRALRAALLSLCLLSSSAAAGEWAEGQKLLENGRYLRDADGVEYRVAFEPADRIWLGVSGAWQSVAGEQSWVGSAHLGVDLLWVWALGEGRDAVRWQFEHGFVEGRVDLGQ